jgi:hypothetical protein
MLGKKDFLGQKSKIKSVDGPSYFDFPYGQMSIQHLISMLRIQLIT